MNLPNLPVPQRVLRDAARLALQSAAAAALTFITMESMQMPEKFVGILSTVLVVQPSVGNTVFEAVDRIIATLIGCMIGIVCLWMLPAGYGTAAALALAMLVMNGIAGFRPQWRYGVVAAVALALGSDADLVQTAIERSTAIGVGSVIGALVSVVLWSDSSTKRARSHLQDALEAIGDLLQHCVSVAQSDEDLDLGESQDEFHARIADARSAAAGIVWGDSDALKARIERVDRLYNSVLIVKRVAEEADALTDGHEGLKSAIDDAAKALCVIIRGLADKDSQQQENVAEARDKVDALRNRLEGLDGSDEQALRQSALAFGLKETLQQLAALTE